MPFLTVTIGINPTVFSFGPLQIHWYGVAYVAAIALGLRVILPYAQWRQVPSDVVWSVAVWAIPAGLIGGRVYFVAQNDLTGYLTDPLRVFAIWNGGMAYFGAVFAVIATVVFLAIRQRQPLLQMLDIAALFALVGQPIGRLGNVVNGDVLGPPTNLPWSFQYTHPESFAADPNEAYHPAAVYEIIANIVLIAVLVPLRKRLSPGGLAASYVAGYAVSQLIVFIWRAEPVIVLGLQQAQITALAVLAIEAAVVVAYLLHRRRRPVAAK